MNKSHHDKYRFLLNLMASSMDLNGELPSMYSDEFKGAVAELLLIEKEDSIHTYGYIQFSCLVDNFRSDGKILELMSHYLKSDEEAHERSLLAVKIVNEIAKSAMLYYREDIEQEVEDLYKRKYPEEYYGSFEQIPHSL